MQRDRDIDLIGLDRDVLESGRFCSLKAALFALLLSLTLTEEAYKVQPGRRSPAASPISPALSDIVR